MKLSFSKSFWSSCALGVGLLAASLVSTNRVSAQDCPFLDDDVILYHSPSTVVEAGAIPKIWGCDEGKAALDSILKKIEEEVAKNAEKGDFPKEKFDYLAARYKEALGEDPTPISLLSTYFHRVDGVVFALDVPENLSDAKNGLSLTYLVDFDPMKIDFRKLFKEGEELFVAKDENGIFIAKLVAKDGDAQEEKSFFFGTTQVKETDEYAVVFAATEEMVEKKLTRFQQTNAFVVKRLGDEKVYVEHIFKTDFFASAVKALDEKADEKSSGLKDALTKVKSVRFKALAKDDATAIALELEASDAESAKMFCDLAIGGVAALGLTTKNKDLKPEETLGLKVLKSVEFSRASADDVVARAALTLDFDEMKELAKTFVWDKIKDKANVVDKLKSAVDSVKD